MKMLATVSNGQVTIPAAIRNRPSLQDGDNLVFREQNGKVFIDNSSPTARALAPIQEALKGRAEEAGIRNEDDIQRLVDEVRYGK